MLKDLIHLLSNDFVEHLSVPASVLGSGDTQKNRTDKVPVLRKLIFQSGCRQVNR